MKVNSIVPGFEAIFDPGRFLYDAGLLFKINTEVLHPLGLSMGVMPPPENNPEAQYTIVILDYRKSNNPVKLSEEDFAVGLAKFSKTFNK